ncbi:MAG: hypothetical protein M0P64_03870 [Candidatus Pacebacteria bacterium]|jgi:hypothetical protein|nr:hypothetical protein [Candidatus Paceibacterota bacterium]
MRKFKSGDLVWLTKFALSKDGLGGKDYVPNSCTGKLLQGYAIKVHDSVSVVEGSKAYSVRFEGGSYSLSASHFELALANKRKVPFEILVERFLRSAFKSFSA